MLPGTKKAARHSREFVEIRIRRIGVRINLDGTRARRHSTQIKLDDLLGRGDRRGRFILKDAFGFGDVIAEDLVLAVEIQISHLLREGLVDLGGETP